MLLMVKMCELMRSRSAGIIAVLVMTALTAAPAAAQETREEEIAKKQAEKAAKAEPYKPTRFEKIMDRLEASFASPPNGFYPTLGSIYPGGGFTPGVGYRRFYNRNAVWSITGLYSIRNYKQIEFDTHKPWHLEGKWTYGVQGGWLDATQVGFYGIGPDSPSDNRANYRVFDTYIRANATYRPTWWTRVGAGIAYEDLKTEEGQGRHPSIETVYTPTTAPGLGSSPDYIHSQGTAAIDWRPAAGYARRGGYYGVTVHNFSDVDDTFSFRRLDGELIQHLPVLRENWVLSFRGRVQTVLDDTAIVPYFMMPQLGSGSTLRAYSTGRFRDRHAFLTSAELRWIPNRLALDMALFYDAGQVAFRREDIFSDLHTNWGIGARFHGPTITVLRIEAARGAEGWNLVIAANAAF